MSRGSVLGPLSYPSVFSPQQPGVSCLPSLCTHSPCYAIVPAILTSTFSSALSLRPQIGTVNSLPEVSTLVYDSHLRLNVARAHFASHTPNRMVALLNSCSRQTQMASLFHLLGLCFSFRKTQRNNVLKNFDVLILF